MSTGRLHIRVTGLAQGIGYRPFVHRLATARGLTGWVANTGAGVEIELEGPEQGLLAATRALADDGLEGQRRLQWQRLEPLGYAEFTIAASQRRGAGASPPRDLAPCAICLKELFDPSNRRYRYPFIACARCGPRYSILLDLPWDRARTTLAAFPLCPLCRAEYQDPQDRRFHAEATGCGACGPRLALQGADGEHGTGAAALRAAAARLAAGQIVAIKSVGGYQLAVDARDEAAVQRLRDRKGRPHKPLAVMAVDLAQAAELAALDEASRDLLRAPGAPIALLARRRPCPLAPAVAPGTPRLGLMLPCSPLHHLLLRDFAGPLVMTSGNRAGQPLVADDGEALELLDSVADAVLSHDRAIAQPLDDAIVEVAAGAPRVLRLGRGYAPLELTLKHAQREPLVALGGDLKHSAALAAGDRVMLTPYVGDLASEGALRRARQQLAAACRLRGLAPTAWVTDAHPDTTTRRLLPCPPQERPPVQHHHAHVAACMAEHGLTGEVLGVAWDGMGYGGDGTLWGGEFLLCSGAGYRPVARLRPFALPGGDAAVRQPLRIAVALLCAAGLPADGLAGEEQLSVWQRMIEGGINAPLTSSAGRLFDGVAALLGLAPAVSFEGQAALALEALAAGGPAAPLPFATAALDGLLELDWRPALRVLHRARAGPVADGRPEAAALSATFHAMLVAMIAEVAGRWRLPVVLTGGCFQNRRLLEGAQRALAAQHLAVYTPQRVPPGDGGLALGQAAVVAARDAAAGA